jgi:hypothetical protein
VNSPQSDEFIKRSGITVSSGPGRSILTGVLDKSLSKADIQSLKNGQRSKAVQNLIENHNPNFYGVRTPVPEPMKQRVLKRDKHCCRACKSNTRLCFDHIIPVSRGGLTVPKNLQILCRVCNSIKSDRLMTLREIRARRIEKGYPAQYSPNTPQSRRSANYITPSRT